MVIKTLEHNINISSIYYNINNQKGLENEEYLKFFLIHKNLKIVVQRVNVHRTSGFHLTLYTSHKICSVFFNIF